ncbi:MAG: cation diffusion facilitator family transporter [Desulfuromonadales bacterium]|nr:cation diffusion facilitator family transporter [Desulfuromonadales bacterium]
MANSARKIGAARLSVAAAVSLAVVKLATGLLTGSLAVLSSAIDSLLDILMSGVNLFAIQHAEQPADERHPYGHGKFETLATIFQSLAIAASGGWIIYEALKRLAAGSTVTSPGSGMVVMAGSLVVSWFLSRHLRRTAHETDSSALEADSLHFAMDVYTNLALLVGLGLLALFNLPWLDPVMSLLVAVYILYEALRLLRRGMGDVLDEQLPETVRSEIERLIDDHKHELFGFHNLRTRRAGSQKLIDFHLTVCKHLSVAEAHDITDYLERRIAGQIQGTDVTIHVEPCRRHDCPGREHCPAQTVRGKHENGEKPWWEV